MTLSFLGLMAIKAIYQYVKTIINIIIVNFTKKIKKALRKEVFSKRFDKCI